MENGKVVEEIQEDPNKDKLAYARTVWRRNNQLLKDYKGGMPRKEIGYKYDISQPMVTKILRQTTRGDPNKIEKERSANIRKNEVYGKSEEDGASGDKPIKPDEEVAKKSTINTVIDNLANISTHSKAFTEKEEEDMEKDIQREIEREVKMARLELLDEMRKEINNLIKPLSADKDSIMSKIKDITDGLKDNSNLSATAKKQVDVLSEMMNQIKDSIPKVPDISADVLSVLPALPGIKKKVDELPEDFCTQWPEVCRIAKLTKHNPGNHESIEEIMSCPGCDADKWIKENLGSLLPSYVGSEKGQQNMAKMLQQAGWRVTKDGEPAEEHRTETGNPEGEGKTEKRRPIV